MALWVWLVTIAVIIGLIAFDYFFHVRQAHIPSLKEATKWSIIYIGFAIIFGILVWVFGGGQMGYDFFAAYLTEKALSVDNLFVFLIIMSSFAVPRMDQQKVLLFGIVFALISRSALIFAGKALIDNFSWMFYLFGLVLIVTAGKLLAAKEENDGEPADSFIIRLAKKLLRTTDHYDEDKLFTVENGKRVLTPMMLVMIAIGGTDVLFALDSIPAVYGLTTNVFLVFTATAFSLMGLRQLYFLLNGLLDRLLYLNYGLAVILGFIGVKLVLHALHENTIWIINKGQPIEVYEITSQQSLVAIIIILIFTVIISLLSPKGRVASLIGQTVRAAQTYLAVEYHADPQEREDVYQTMCDKEIKLKELNRDLVKEDDDYSLVHRLLQKAHKVHQEMTN